MLAHGDAPHVVRFRRALGDIPVVLHCDRKTPEPVFAQMTLPTAGMLRTVARGDTKLASWSLVDAEMRALEAALTWTRADYFAVCSGADYPLLPPDEIGKELAGLGGQSWIWNLPIPYARWNSRLFKDGGYWRTKFHYLHRGDNLLTIKGHPLPIPIKRGVPPELNLRASSHWKVYGAEDAAAVLDVWRNRPDLVRFWRSTCTPEESFSATVLASPKSTGRPPLAVSQSSAWQIEWAHDLEQHPRWLDESSLTGLVTAANGHPDGRRSLFARKFRTGGSDKLLDEIDGQLLADIDGKEIHD